MIDLKNYGYITRDEVMECGDIIESYYNAKSEARRELRGESLPSGPGQDIPEPVVIMKSEFSDVDSEDIPLNQDVDGDIDEQLYDKKELKEDLDLVKEDQQDVNMEEEVPGIEHHDAHAKFKELDGVVMEEKEEKKNPLSLKEQLDLLKSEALRDVFSQLQGGPNNTNSQQEPQLNDALEQLIHVAVDDAINDSMKNLLNPESQFYVSDSDIPESISVAEATLLDAALRKIALGVNYDITNEEQRELIAHDVTSASAEFAVNESVVNTVRKEEEGGGQGTGEGGLGLTDTSDFANGIVFSAGAKNSYFNLEQETINSQGTFAKSNTANNVKNLNLNQSSSILDQNVPLISANRALGQTSSGEEGTEKPPQPLDTARSYANDMADHLISAGVRVADQSDENENENDSNQNIDVQNNESYQNSNFVVIENESSDEDKVEETNSKPSKVDQQLQSQSDLATNLNQIQNPDQQIQNDTNQTLGLDSSALTQSQGPVVDSSLAPSSDALNNLNSSSSDDKNTNNIPVQEQIKIQKVEENLAQMRASQMKQLHEELNLGSLNQQDNGGGVNNNSNAAAANSDRTNTITNTQQTVNESDNQQEPQALPQEPDHTFNAINMTGTPDSDNEDYSPEGSIQSEEA